MIIALTNAGLTWVFQSDVGVEKNIGLKPLLAFKYVNQSSAESRPHSIQLVYHSFESIEEP